MGLIGKRRSSLCCGHFFRDAGYPDDPVMHGLVAGLWSSLSGAGRFVSRWGSGGLVDWIGFNATAAIVTSLQVAIVSIKWLQIEFKHKNGFKRNSARSRFLH